MVNGGSTTHKLQTRIDTMTIISKNTDLRHDQDFARFKTKVNLYNDVS